MTAAKDSVEQERLFSTTVPVLHSPEGTRIALCKLRSIRATLAVWNSC